MLDKTNYGQLRLILKDFSVPRSPHPKCIIGVCDATPLKYIPKGNTPFVSSNPEKRSNPASILSGVESIIVMGVPHDIVTYPPMLEGAGIISKLAIAKDYHVTVKALLKDLASKLQEYHGFKYKILVDSPNLDERALAVKAGLGFYGRNRLVVSPEYGSRFCIGVMLTDIPVDALRNEDDKHNRRNDTLAKPVSNCPPNCQNCIKSCPNGALSPNGLDVTLCISYLTQKESMSLEEANYIGCYLYGCDICQDVCPLNTPQSQAWANPEDWLSMTDDDYINIYGHTPMLWRGAALLRRNAKAVIDNRKN